MEQSRFICGCVTKAAEELGYPTMKMEQLAVAMAFVEGSDVFAILPSAYWIREVFVLCLLTSVIRQLDVRARSGLFYSCSGDSPSGNNEIKTFSAHLWWSMTVFTVQDGI